MLSPRQVPPGAPLEAKEEYLERFMRAMDRGLDAVHTLAAGGPADANGLEIYAEVLESLRIGREDRTLSAGAFLDPTEDDVSEARVLVQLVRDGAAHELLVEAARSARRVVTDGAALETLHAALVCIEKEASRVEQLPRIMEVLDETVRFFERGCSVAGFVPTSVDVANVRRLREIVDADGAGARDERGGLVKELLARFPPGSVVARRCPLRGPRPFSPGPRVRRARLRSGIAEPQGASGHCPRVRATLTLKPCADHRRHRRKHAQE